MAQKPSSLRRTVKAFDRRAREFKMIVNGLISTDHPVLAHIIPMRRCNLACAHCNEYDDISKPGPLATMKSPPERVAALGRTLLSINGGEAFIRARRAPCVAHQRDAGLWTRDS